MPSQTILFVDDNSDIRELLRELFEDVGIQLVAAETGYEGIDLASEQSFDLFLLDLGLPDMDGFELWKEITELEKNRRIPVILLTGRDSQEAQLKGFQQGAADFIRKPFNPLELLARVTSKLRLKQESDQIEEENRKSQQRTYEELFRMSKAIDCSSDAVVIEDGGGEPIYQNQAATNLLGCTLQELKEKGGLISLYVDPKVWQAARDICKENKTWRGEVEMKGPNGDIMSILNRTDTIVDDTGKSIGTVSIHSDISEQKRMERDIIFLADHDPLTKVFNRRLFTEMIQQTVASAKEGINAVLLYLDLDNFKVINDNLGHQAGDRLIKEISEILRQNIRETDILGRLGGDEFGVLLKNTTLEQAREFAKMFLEWFREYRFTDEGATYTSGMSIGIAEVTGQESSEDVLAHADCACYEAKANGRNRFEVFREGETEFYRLSLYAAESVKVKDALTDGRLELWAQPIVSIDEPRPKLLEVLLRMKDRDGAMLLPGMFIPAAERFGSIVQLDQFVVTSAIDVLAGTEGIHFSVNLSAASLNEKETVALIRSRLEQTGVDPCRLVFEVTESGMISNMGIARDFLIEVRSIGCKVALDDFGMGFSSMSYLRDLPFDILKIDGSFFRNLNKDSLNQALVRSINDVAQTLGKTTVGEFIETAQVLEITREIGLNYAQGYHLGKPRPIHEWIEGEFPVA
ncbi:MAG TPA: EAL domain-containing protein [Verrucomicrobiales bacterium]|nr:EAL domain-containing protein [Verrucomicrobiales bacterium]